jgi:methionyl-tRNA formyltransferase
MTRRVVPFVDHEIGFRLLSKLFENFERGEILIPTVITTMENGKKWWPGVKELCADWGVPIIEYDESFPTKSVMKEADWFLLLSWKHIIPKSLLILPKLGALNLHYSLLPSYRGTYPVNWAIISGEVKTGFSFHLVDEEIDKGQTLIQHEIQIRFTDTARTLQLRLDDLVCEKYDDLLQLLLEFDPKSHVREVSKGSDPVFELNSRERFERIRQIELNKQYSGLEFINLLRGLTFMESSKIAFFIDPERGERVYIDIRLDKAE